MALSHIVFESHILFAAPGLTHSRVAFRQNHKAPMLPSPPWTAGKRKLPAATKQWLFHLWIVFVLFFFFHTAEFANILCIFHPLPHLLEVPLQSWWRRKKTFNRKWSWASIVCTTDPGRSGSPWAQNSRVCRNNTETEATPCASLRFGQTSEQWVPSAAASAWGEEGTDSSDCNWTWNMQINILQMVGELLLWEEVIGASYSCSASGIRKSSQFRRDCDM